MKIQKALRRKKNYTKRWYGMKIDGRSTKDFPRFQVKRVISEHLGEGGTQTLANIYFTARSIKFK